MTTLGIDVGGTTTKVGVLRDGAFADERVLATPQRSASIVDNIVDNIVDIIGSAADRQQVDAVGVVVPGYVDAARGIGVRSENLGWTDAPFRDLIVARTTLPVAFGHDVRAGALAESRLGAARRWRDVLFVPVGTGVAAGLVLGGVVIDHRTAVGEIGHVDVGHGETCACGRTGCAEAIASAAAIARRYAAATGHTVSAAEVAAKVRSGDPAASSVWTDAVEALASVLAPGIGLVAPEAVVVGGGLAAAGDTLLGPLRASLGRRLSDRVLPEVVPAALGTSAGCVGAALLAEDLLR